MFQTLSLFRWVALLEGVSFLVLLGIAMPLKYLGGQPQAVRVVGMAHGVLFIAYVVLLIGLFIGGALNAKRAGTAFLLSLLPFGTFILDKSLRTQLRALAESVAG
jgi:integral membrane protein